jgi:hypothetical protein
MEIQQLGVTQQALHWLLTAGGMFAGYAWSLDTYVDFTWDELTKLSVILIVLLVVEVSCAASEQLFAFPRGAGEWHLAALQATCSCA